VICVAILCGGCGSPASGVRKEYEELKGNWEVTAVVLYGNPLSAERVKEMGLRYTFDGDKVTVTHNLGRGQAYTLTIDASTTPKKMTMDPGVGGEPPIRAIYALESNKLLMCTMDENKVDAGYPTELVSTASPHTCLNTLERR
jgi:uncharacterized protein (TIGR03067 family)